MVEQLRSIRRKVIVEKEKLKRELGVAGLFSSAYGDVGSSIYYALGVVTVFALGAAPLAILCAGIFYVCTVLTFMEGTTMMPFAGGTATFTRKAFNEGTSFFVGWIALLAYIVTISMSVITSVYYLSYFVPVLKTPIPVTIGTLSFMTDPHYFVVAVAVIFVLGLMTLNVSGVKEAAAFNIFFAVIDIMTQSLLIILGFILVLNIDKLTGFRHMGPEYWPTLPQFIKSIAIAMVAYTGLETIAQLAEEADDYKKKIPKAYIFLIIVVLLMYIGLPNVALSVMTPSQLATEWKTDPIAGIAHYMPNLLIFGKSIVLKDIFGPWIAMLAVSILLMATNAGIMGASRLAYSMGQHRQLPAFLFKLHRKYNTPYVAIITFCGVAVFLLLLGIIWRDIFVKLATIYAFSSVLNFSFAHLSIIVLRFKEPGHERPFKIPLNLKIMGKELPLPSAIGLIGNTCVWVILTAGESWARITGTIWMVMGFAGYIIFRKVQKIPIMEAVTIERVVEAAYQPLEFYDIIVPTVGDLDASMIQTACKIALKDKSRILAVYVIEVPMTLPLDAKMTAEKEKGERALDQAEIIGKEYEVAVDTKLVQARSAGKAIVDEAVKRKSDLIMLGQPDKHDVNEIIGGKTINYVAQNAPCKVLINIAEKS